MADSGAMKTSDNGRDVLVKPEEGWVPRVYHDQCGIPTIGYGHKLRPGEAFPNGITQEEGDALLVQDLATAEHFVNTLVDAPLSQNQFDALVDFTFNCGGGALQHSAVLTKLNAGDYQGAADALLAWNKGMVAGKLVVVGALDSRRKAERALFLTPDGSVGEIAEEALSEAQRTPSTPPEAA